jgi:hypothetical protein
MIRRSCRADGKHAGALPQAPPGGARCWAVCKQWLLLHCIRSPSSKIPSQLQCYVSTPFYRPAVDMPAMLGITGFSTFHLGTPMSCQYL